MKDILIAALPATLPTLTVLAGILLNQTGINRLDARISALDGRITALDAGVSSLRKQLHDNIIMLVGRETDKAERLARLEERSKS